MLQSICRKVVLTGVCLAASCWAHGQVIHLGEQPPDHFDLAATYTPAVANVTIGNEFGMEGGSIQAQAHVWRRIYAAADFAGFHAGDVNNSGVGLDLLTATFGPRYVWAPEHRRVTFFGQVLAGEAFGLDGIFPTSTGVKSTANSLALQIGGGINLPLTSHFSVRAFDANWLRTQLPNATTNVQNNLRLSVGMVYRIR
jgi:hypothetical protein